MPFYRDHVYPRLVDMLGDPSPIQEIRQRTVRLAQGTVLEIGVGSGANFLYYDPANVRKLYALEPNVGMRQLAERQRRRTKLEIEFLDFPGERIPLEDGSVDTVVTTFTLCTIPGVVDAIRGMARVLKPGGTLIFVEHGLSLDPRVRRWQERWEPVHKWLFEGLHLTRDIPALLTQGGFHVEQAEPLYLAAFPRSWAHCWYGTATPQAR